MKEKEPLQKIIDFVNEIGIPCREDIVKDNTFLPGVDIVQGAIIYQSEKLLSPGDILHEAGHIAVLLPKDRAVVTSPDVSGDLDKGGAEIAAIAWSWAALKYLAIDPEVVFHTDGYRGASYSLIKNFSTEQYIGVPLLQWFGMTKEKDRATENDTVYPAMSNWLRQ